MKIKITHKYRRPALKEQISSHPDISGRDIAWSDHRGEGSYGGCRITLELIGESPESCRIEAVISGPGMLLAFLENRIRTALESFFARLDL